MAKGCWIRPCVKNSAGEIVFSKLWDDLYKITNNNREKTLSLYRIASNEAFVNSVKDVAEFDKNGQVTARSFLELSGKLNEVDNIADMLNKEYGSSNLSNEDVVDRIEKFNKEESYSKEYVPVVEEIPDAKTSKYTMAIAERNENTVSRLISKLKDIKLTSLIERRLKQLGVAYDFVGSKQYNGRFSTQNAEKMSDGLYHLIEVSKGSKYSDSLIEEAAHLATVSMKDSTIIQRLLALIKNGSVNDLFTQEELDSAGANPQYRDLELAGILVKKAIQNKNLLGFGGFFSRVKSAIFDVFSKGDKLWESSDKRLAEFYAERIANGFLYNSNEFDVNTALKSNVKLFSINLDGTNQLLQQTLSQINNSASRINLASQNLWESINKAININKNIDNRSLDSISYVESAAIISDAVTGLITSFNEQFDIVKNLNFSGPISTTEMNALFTTIELYQLLSIISDRSDEYLRDEYKTHIEEADNKVRVIIDQINGALKGINDGVKNGSIPSSLLQKCRAATANIYEEILGTPIYSETLGIGIDGLDRGTRKYTVSDLASQYLNEGNFTILNRIGGVFRQGQNKEDLTSQLFYEQIRKAKTNQSLRYIEAIDSLKKIEKRAKDFGINVVDLYERLEDGSFSGNFIDLYNIGQFQLDKQKVVDKITRDFIETKKADGTFDDFMNKTISARLVEFYEFKQNDKRLEDFYKTAYKDLENKILSDKYINNEYLELEEKYNNNFSVILNEIKEWKRDVDRSCLIEGGLEREDFKKEFGYYPDEEPSGRRLYAANRIPQFRGSFIDRIKNRSDTDKFLYNNNHIKEMCLDVTSENFGSIIDEDIPSEFLDQYAMQNVIPENSLLYGIRKLPDQRDLSRDLFESLSFYAGMAYRFATTQQVYSQLMVVDATLKNRSTNSNSSIGFASQSNIDRNEMLDEYILGKKKRRPSIAVLSKILFLSAVKILSMGFLPGLNMPGLKNFIGGYRVIFNDAIVNRSGLRMGDLIKATKRNVGLRHMAGQIASTWTMKEKNWDKYQMLIKRWDAVRDPKIDVVAGGSSVRHFFGGLVNILLRNYGYGDQALIAISYDSMMSGVEVYDLKGNRVSLPENGYEYDENNIPSLRQDLIKNREDIELYNLLKNAISELTDIITENKKAEKGDEITRLDSPSETPRFSELITYLENQDLDIGLYRPKSEGAGFKSPEDILYALNKKLEDISFTIDDETKECSKINDYICSSQGLYGALNANALMLNTETAVITKLKGWYFGFVQRNLLSNSSAVNKKYKEAVFATELFALASLFADGSKITAENAGLSTKQYKWCLTKAMLIPFALKSKKLQAHLLRAGWTPDQLGNMAYFIIGVFINMILYAISKYLLQKGNDKQYGEQLVKHEDKRNKSFKYKAPGLLFEAFDLIKKDEEKIDSQSEKFEKNPTFTSGQKKNVDGEVNNFTDLPPLRLKDGTLNYDVKENDVYYVLSRDKYYKPNTERNRWISVPFGEYVDGSDEYNEHLLGIEKRNYYYDTKDPMYYFLGAANRLNLGVLSEGESLINPSSAYYDTKELMVPITISDAVVSILDLGDAVFNNNWDEYLTKKINFILKKKGLEFDGGGTDLFTLGDHNVSLLDFYKQQQKTEQFEEFKHRR